MKLLVLLSLCLMFLSGCENPEARLEFVAGDEGHQFILETFEINMINLRYTDKTGQESLIQLNETMIVNEIPSTLGRHTLLIRYLDAEFELWIELIEEPMKNCQVYFQAIDLNTDADLYQDTYLNYQVPQTEEGCPLLEFIEPWEIEGYIFSHFSQDLNDLFSDQTIIEVYVYYEPTLYTINFYDHEGQLIETIQARLHEYLGDYQYDFPEYYQFQSWDQNLSSIYEDLDVYPNGNLVNYYVYFYDLNDEFLTARYVKHGEAIDPEPYRLEHPGYEFIGWSKPLTNITNDQPIYALYEKIVVVDDKIDDLNALNNYTATIAWEGVPYGDGTLSHTFWVDQNNICAFAFEEEFYLLIEGGTTYIIAQYEDDPTWVKTVYLGDSVEDYLLIDIFALEDVMIHFNDSLQTIDQSHYETLFGPDYADVHQVTVSSSKDSILIVIDFTDGMKAEITIEAIGQTEVEIPDDYIDPYDN